MYYWLSRNKGALLVLALVLAMITTLPVSSLGAENIKVKIDGANLVMEVPPYIEGSTLMLPVRALFEALGASVEMQDTGLIVGNKGETEVTMSIGSDKATIDGVQVSLAVPVMPVGERTLAPVRFVAESLNCYVSWDQVHQTAIVLSGENDIAGYPETPDAVVAAFLIAHGNGNANIQKYCSSNESWKSWVAGQAFYSLLKVVKIEERGAVGDIEYDTVQSIQQQTGLPCKAFRADWYCELTDYAKSGNYTRSEGNNTGWFYLVQESDGKWKVESGLNTGP